MRKREIYLVLFISFLISNCAHCQIVENGIRITDLWLKFLFDTFPQYFPGNLMSTPVLFLPQIKRLPAEVLKILNLPVPTYDSSSESEYSVVNILEQFFGVDLFTLAFIASLYFIASLALVSIVIPNLYFRLMLWADVTEDSANIYQDYDYDRQSPAASEAAQVALQDFDYY